MEKDARELDACIPVWIVLPIRIVTGEYIRLYLSELAATESLWDHYISIGDRYVQ